MSSNFAYDLAFGQKGEGLLKNLISATDELTIEVKRDRLSSITGNIAIEIEYKGRPSGIMKTEAMWWAYILAGGQYRDEVIILIKTERLRSLVEKHRARRGTVKGGDGKQSRLVLVPLSEFLSILGEEDE